jgi:soluble lytic murein transglycosylase-like protein
MLLAAHSRRSVQQAETPITFPIRPNILKWVVIAVVVVVIVPNVLSSAARTIRRALTPPGQIAPLFTPEIDYWREDIARWSQQHNADPNMLATIMQIESCGHPNISSYAGAQGLFQVMPFHFADGENQIDPDTNAMRGASFINQCIGWANGDLGLALACYNGGPSILSKSYQQWSDQTQRYYKWGVGIYADAIMGSERSATLDAWLNAGGRGLCSLAADEINLSASS